MNSKTPDHDYVDQSCKVLWIFVASVLVILLFHGRLEAKFIARTDDGSISLSRSDLVTKHQFKEIRGKWRFKEGDSTRWRFPEYQDGHWALVNPFDPFDSIKKDSWEGVGWFRLVVRIDTSLANVPLAMKLTCRGALDIFLDGDSVSSILPEFSEGKKEYFSRETIPLVPFYFTEPGEHVFAFRLKGPERFKLRGSLLRPGYTLTIGDEEKLSEVLTVAAKWNPIFHLIFLGAMMVFSFLHLVLYLFNRDARANLYFFGFALSVICLIIISYVSSLPVNMRHSRLLMFILALVITWFSISGVRFIYEIFYKKIRSYFKYMVLTGIVLLVLSDRIDYRLTLIWAVIMMLDMARLIILATIQKKELAWLFSICFLSFLGMVLYEMIGSLRILPVVIPFRSMFLAGVDNMMLVMSIYLARDMGKNNRRLKQQLVEIEELSQENLKREREAALHQMENVRLEEENKRKAIELEKAIRIKKANEALEEANEELKRINSELKNTQVQLVRSEKLASLGKLAAGLAHEMNNPMGALMSMQQTLMKAVQRLEHALSESMSDFPVPERINKTLSIMLQSNDVIGTATKRVNDIVQKLKTFAHLDEAELQLSCINAEIEDTLAMMQHEFTPEVNVCKEYCELPRIKCYPAKLNQLFFQIFSNALSAIDSDGQISIKTMEEDESIRIEISDNGIGILEEDLEKVFDPGFSRWNMDVGVGLGLPISYQIVKEHNGELEIQSANGEETKVTIILPKDLELKNQRAS